jgi:hypothetical protein
MKRLSLLLLDANVVIYLFELGIWDRVLSLCDIHLARTVIDEAQFYEDDQGGKHPFDLSSYVDNKAMAAFDVLPSQMQAFFEQFDPVYLDVADRMNPRKSDRMRGTRSADTRRMGSVGGTRNAERGTRRSDRQKSSSSWESEPRRIAMR